jgi:hypothetical protein
MVFRDSAATWRRVMLVAILAAVTVAISAGGVTFAAYIATTETPGNDIEVGSVKLDDNDSGTALLSLVGAEPGAADSGCIGVTFGGSLPSTVRLYGSTSGSGLDEYLDLVVTRGSYSGADPGPGACTGFQPDPVDYTGDGLGVVYAGRLSAFPNDFAGGIGDPPSGTAETWVEGERHVYRLEVSLRHDHDASGLDTTQSFTWEARNE